MIREKYGTKAVIACKSVSPEWGFWFVTEHPDIETLQKERAENDELDWHRYMHSANMMLGTRFEIRS